MDYQKIINLLDNTPNQPSKFKTKNLIEINDEPRGRYNKDNQTRFETSMLGSSFCDHSDANILVKGTITVANTAAGAAAANNVNKKVIFKNCAPFTNRISSTQVDDAHDIDVEIPLYNLIEYSDDYLKTSGILQQYCRDEQDLANNSDIAYFNEGNATSSFDLKEK